MAIVNFKDMLGCIQLRGRVGLPCCLGSYWLGYSELGDDNPLAGIYQKRKGAKRQICVRMVHYFPDEGHTAVQIDNRLFFKYICQTWHALTEEERNHYRQMWIKAGWSGYNNYLSIYLYERPTQLGNTFCGYSVLGDLTR